jgi:RimJ/RimL family protein N-acetyltransferase
LKLLFGHDAIVAEWVANQIPHVGFGEAFGPCAAIGCVDDNGIIRAGAVYHGYQPRFRGIEISFAKAPEAVLTRGVVGGLLRYPFEQLQCVRVTACAPLKATSTREFLEKLGFKREGVVRLGFGDDHAAIYGMLARREWAHSPFRSRFAPVA